MKEIQPIKIAITALGGQGGGVLSNWIVALGEANGFIAQSTSVPGVAQRTGATIYYVELFPKNVASTKGKSPVLALMPVPGDVDIVIASEFMEAGRAIIRGLVTEKTTLIASSHRDYAIAEKIDMADGRQETNAIRRIAKKNAKSLIEADMAAVASTAGSPISAVLFGALCGAGVLPFPRDTFEHTVKKSGRSVESNLCGFAAGVDVAKNAASTNSKSTESVDAPSKTVSPTGGLFERVGNEFPESIQPIMVEGLKRALDFQDRQYAEMYFVRVREIYEIDQKKGGTSHGWRLTYSVAKYLALWMAYDDAIRVADLKTRNTRFERFRQDVHAPPDQIVMVSEYLHPRLEEICDLLPTWLARAVLSNKILSSTVGSMLGKGRRIPTTKMRGFIPLYFLASFKFVRRWSYRFGLEQNRIDDWLTRIKSLVETDYILACELAELQRLIKGYGETHERGLRNFRQIYAAIDRIKHRPDAAKILGSLRDAALKDEDGVVLNRALQELDTIVSAV